MKKFTEETLIPVSLVIVIIGGILWLSHIAEVAEATAKAQTTLQIKVDSIAEIKTDVEVIKSDMKWIKENLQKR